MEVKKDVQMFLHSNMFKTVQKSVKVKERSSLTAKNFPASCSVAPNEIIIMYGMNVMRKNITDETVPMLADEKNVEHIKLHKKEIKST